MFTLSQYGEFDFKVPKREVEGESHFSIEFKLMFNCIIGEMYMLGMI